MHRTRKSVYLPLTKPPDWDEAKPWTDSTAFEYGLHMQLPHFHLSIGHSNYSRTATTVTSNCPLNFYRPYTTEKVR